MTEQLQPKDEHDFNVLMGTIFALSIAIEYQDGIQAVLTDRKANYALNKAKSAEKGCIDLHNTLLREVVKRMNPEQKKITLAAIEAQKQVVYRFFSLDRKEQVRVEGLLAKIERERKL